MRTVSGEEPVLSGEKNVHVNPAIDTLSVTIPTGYNDDGTTKFDDFAKGKTHSVDPKLLKLKNTEGINYFVENNKEGGE
jgi:hypothetical protein